MDIEEDAEEGRKGDEGMDTTMKQERYCTVEESIIQSCKEVSLMRKGELEKRSWKAFANKKRKELGKDND